MSREDIHKLIGGYATGTLTPEEREALFAAALEDQELFDALAREQAMRDLLSDPAARSQVLAALDERPQKWYERMGWLRPAAAALAVAGLAAVAFVGLRQRASTPLASRNMAPMMAEVKRPAMPLASTPPVKDAAATTGTPTKKTPPAESRTGPPRRAMAAPAARAAGSARKPVDVVSENGAGAPAPAPSAAAPAAIPPPKVEPAAQAKANEAAPPAEQRLESATQQVQVAPQQAPQTVTVRGEARPPVANAPMFTANPLLPSERDTALAAGGRGGAGGGGGGGSSRPAISPGAMQIYDLASRQQAGAAGGVMPAAQFARVPANGMLALRYSFLRRNSEGESSLVNLSERRPGDTLLIQFTPASDGYLTVTPVGGATLVAVPVVRLRPMTVPIPEDIQQISVTFSGASVVALEKTAADKKKSAVATTAAAPAAAAPAAPPQTESVAGVTYVGARTQQGAIQFSISLK